MNEKKAKDRAELILDALTNLAIGKEPGWFSNDAFRKLATHPNFNEIKNVYIAYLQTFDGKIDTPEKIKALFDFRMKLINLFD